MGRKLRYLPEGGALVEVTCRTLQGRLLLRPDPELNDIAAGILGRSQRLYPVDIVGYIVMSTHYLWEAEHKEDLSKDVPPPPACAVPPVPTYPSPWPLAPPRPGSDLASLSR